MSDSLSRVSSKYQTVIPKAVRNRLSLKTGDTLRFRVTSAGTVTLEKVKSAEDDPFATFEEWNSDEDERLYSDL
jgi:antitoxin PrlF